MDSFPHCVQQLLARFSELPVSLLWQDLAHRVGSWLTVTDWREAGLAAATSFALIFTAEIGDKSQLVCMALASKHKPWPVLLGASCAFAGLNLLAVVFGAVIAAWLPEYVVAVAIAVLFGSFGIHALMSRVGDDETLTELSGHRIFVTTFLLITVAEFGDKTQLAVVALSSTALAVAVWLGATAALMTTSALGIVAGRTILQRFPLALLHRISGVIFMVLALAAAYRGYLSYATRFS